MDILDDLVTSLGDEQVVPGSMLDRPTSYWDSSPASAAALIRPRNTRGVSEALKICSKHGQQVVIQGGMTNCVRAADARKTEVILSTERLTEIEDINTQNYTATVQAGVVLQNLQEACRERGVIFPLDLAARGSCTIGGNIASNAGGINVLRYGMMRNLVLGLEVVLADGTIVSSLNQMIKNNTGYDLKQMFIGCEGTLGVVTRAVVRVFPESLSRNCALAATSSFDQLQGLLRLFQQCLPGVLSAYEVMWGDYFRVASRAVSRSAPLDEQHDYYVIIETEGADPESDAAAFSETLQSAFESDLINDAVLAKSESERDAIWSIREGFDVILQSPPTYLYDISVPMQFITDYVETVRHATGKRWPGGRCYVFGHVADSNLHLFLSPNEQGDFHADCDEIVYAPLKQFGGSISAEHGIGREKKAWLDLCRSSEEITLMQSLKSMLDPAGLLNDGRIFDTPRQH